MLEHYAPKFRSGASHILVAWCLSVGTTQLALIFLQDSLGYSPLHWAAMRGKEATVAMLVAHGCQPGLLSYGSNMSPAATAAQMAAQHHCAGIAAFLSETLLNSTLTALRISKPDRIKPVGECQDCRLGPTWHEGFCCHTSSGFSQRCTNDCPFNTCP